ncbi:MAG: TerC family protein [Flavobacteriales bacterium]|nr:TerC family protein [Flavobacteriales bacterium]
MLISQVHNKGIILEIFTNSDALMALLTLTFLEIVLGVDNIIFISIAANKVESENRKKAVNLGLFFALLLRIVLLLGLSFVIQAEKTLFSLDWSIFSGAFSGQSIILIIGGIFLIYKSTSEIHHKVEGEVHTEGGDKKGKLSYSYAVMQIMLINAVFSIDSILTAIGMTNGIPHSLAIMIISIILSMLIMMLFANQVSTFVNNHPAIQILGLSFLILIGFMLILEGGHLADFTVAGNKIGSIPKGYLYFAIAFSFGVELLNMRMRKNASIS